MYKLNGIIACSLVLLLACDKNTVFSENKDIDKANWYIKDSAKFSLDISNAAQSYKLYYNVRNSLAYPFYNLYITRQVYDARGKKVDEKLSELILADEKSGRPLGTGLGDIYDHKILIAKAYKFPKAGKYTFELKQFMRQDPLPEVLSVGITLEK